jgi:hypothetical protein
MTDFARDDESSSEDLAALVRGRPAIEESDCDRRCCPVHTREVREIDGGGTDALLLSCEPRRF